MINYEVVKMMSFILNSTVIFVPKIYNKNLSVKNFSIFNIN